LKISESLQEAVISYYTGRLTQEQADELLNWVDQSEENTQYFRQLGKVWHATGCLGEETYHPAEAFARVKSSARERGLRDYPEKELRVKVSSIIRVAAAILFIIGLGTIGLFVTKKSQDIPPNSALVETFAPRGAKSVITLADGTIIWLNADTRLQYPLDYGSTNRNVYLEGEAYFKVAKNKELPFKVIIKDQLTVTALGTAFNVKAYGNEETIETTLEEGSIRIDPSKEIKNRLARTETVILSKNQNAVFYKVEGRSANDQKNMSVAEKQIIPDEVLVTIPVKVVEVNDMRLYTSWKETRWVFKNEKLSSLAPKLERRYDVEFVFVDDVLRDYAFTGTLKEELLEQVLEAIRLTAPIRYEIDNKQVRLYVDKNLMNQYNTISNP
jgi:ferric-dicitrate binding protein FerR (iron transport regulator)